MNVYVTIYGKEKMTSTINFKKKVKQICDDISNLLIRKNKAYGNAALEPIRVFSKLDAKQQILVRIDDKLSRIRNGNFSDDNNSDSLQDLIGYLVLLKIAMDKEGNK